MRLFVSTYCLDDTLTWGKYKGKTIKQIIDTDLSYAAYLADDHIKGEFAFRLDGLALMYYREKKAA